MSESGRQKLLLQSVTALLLLVTAASLWIAGCIRRYPAPTHPVPVKEPYGALADWLDIELPAAVPGVTTALPAAALRLSFGGVDRECFADTSLVDGTEAGLVFEDQERALAAITTRSDPVVVLAPKEHLPCQLLEPMADRILVAVRPAAESDSDGTDQPPPLQGQELSLHCSAPPTNLDGPQVSPSLRPGAG